MDDNSVSVGLNDKAFITPRQKQIIGIWSVNNRIQWESFADSTESYTDAVRNPHFTFHPPGKVHLREERQKDKDPDIFFGLMPLDIMIQQQPTVPWLRLITRPVSGLKELRDYHKDINHEIINYKTHENNSMGINIDLLREPLSGYDKIIKNGFYFIGVNIITLPPQKPILNWYHQF